MASQVRTILDQLSSVIVATSPIVRGVGLQPCNYRFPLEKQPAGGADRRFELLATNTTIREQLVGAGYAAIDLDIRVRVYYVRPGGDAGDGDRKGVNVKAGTDGMRMADSLTMLPNWNQSVTGLRWVTLMAGGQFAKVIDGDKFEVWELRLRAGLNREPWPVAA
jgi:hypothetical protein